MNEDSFNARCDSIDSIHAQLERENAALKAELDRVTGEQGEHAHTMGESIANELREYALGWDERNRVRCDLTAIADRIDAEHEKAMADAYLSGTPTDEKLTELGWVCLPVDADGVPWHINDEFEVDEGIAHVNGIGDNRLFYIDNDGMQWTRSDNKRHYHAPTVEDVLREFALKVAGEDCMTMRTGVVEEYAAKLREVLGE